MKNTNTPAAVTEADVNAALARSVQGEATAADQKLLAGEITRLRDISRGFTLAARRVARTVEKADYAIRLYEDRLNRSTPETRAGKDALYDLLKRSSKALKAAKR